MVSAAKIVNLFPWRVHLAIHIAIILFDGIIPWWSQNMRILDQVGGFPGPAEKACDLRDQVVSVRTSEAVGAQHKAYLFDRQHKRDFFYPPG
jgi:hypothetical protein